MRSIAPSEKDTDSHAMEKSCRAPRFPFGLPHTRNANHVWIQVFYRALNAEGRVGFVIANKKRSAHSYLMKSNEDVRKSAAEAEIAEKAALKSSMEKESKEFVEKGTGVCGKV